MSANCYMPLVMLLGLFPHHGGIQLHHRAPLKRPGKLRYCGLQHFSGADDFANPYNETEEHENDWVLHSGPQHNVLHELRY